MEQVYERCAGLDVHARTVVACRRFPGPRGRRRREVRTFGTTTPELLALSDWLQEVGVTHVAMESTGVYWKPVFNVLESVCEVLLVNAQHVKRVTGRKTDVKDCEWLAELLELGLLRPSFIPPAPIREVQDITRYRKQLVRQRTAEVNRVQKLLESANIKLGQVATNVVGASGRAMLAALLAGERDPQRLADLAMGTLRRKTEGLQAALTGRFTEHHAFLLRQVLEHIDQLDRHIGECDAQVAEYLRPFLQEKVERLQTIPGVGPRTAEVIVAEIGVDMSRFPTAAHLASWAGMCPGNHESAGKRKSGKTRKGSPWLRAALIEAGWAAARTKDSAFSRLFQRVARRRGAKKAVVAVGHRILVTVWQLLAEGTAYQEPVPSPADERQTQRLARHYLRRLEQLGLKVSVEPLPTAA
jgi:transposase